MCYRTGKHTVCRQVPASFSPEILQAGAVKGLMTTWVWTSATTWVWTSACTIRLSAPVANAHTPRTYTTLAWKAEPIGNCHHLILRTCVREETYWVVQAGLFTPLTFARHRLSPLAAFLRDSEFTNFTLPSLKNFLQALSQNVSGNKQ